MSNLRTTSFILTVVKILFAFPLAFFGTVNGIRGIVDHGFDQTTLHGLAIFLGAVGLGYPFSVIPSNKLLKMSMVIFSALPFCSLLACYQLIHPGFLVEWSILLSLVVLVLADIFVARKIHATADSSMKRPPILIAIGCIVCLGIIILAGFWYMLVCAAGAANSLR